MNLLKNILSGAVNQIIFNKESNIGGLLTEITCDANNDPQYAIIATGYFAGNQERYFAVPVLPAFITIDPAEKLTLNLDRSDLVLAKRILFDNCPTIKEDSFFPSVYEVYGYEKPTKQFRKKAI